MQINFRFIIVVMLLIFISACSWDLSVSSGSSEYVYVVFKENTSSNEKDYAKIKVRKGERFREQMPEDPRRMGWLFGGWYDESYNSGGTEYTNDSWVYSDITLYARWGIRGSSNGNNTQNAICLNVDNCVDIRLIDVDNYIETCNEYATVTFYVDNYGVVEELYLNKCDLVLDFAPVVHEFMIDTDKVFNGWLTSPDSSGYIILENTPVEWLAVSAYKVYAELVDR